MRPTHDQSADSHWPVESSHSHHPTAVDETHATDTPDHADHRVHGGHDKHAGHSVAMFRDKFWLSLLLTVPTLVWGHMLQRAFGYSRADVLRERGGSPRSSAPRCFSTAAGRSCRARWREIRDRLPGMMTLIALAIIVAFVFSAAVTLGYPGMPLWEELATLVTIMLLGHWLEMRSISQAQGALGELAKLLPECGNSRLQRRCRGAARRTFPSTRFAKAMSCSFGLGRASRPMASCIAGESAVNEAVITGESRPVDKKPDAKVIAGATQRRGVAARSSHRDRRPHGARRDHATRRAGAELSLARAGARRPSRILAHMGRARCRRGHAHRVARRRRDVRPTRSSDSSQCS